MEIELIDFDRMLKCLKVADGDEPRKVTQAQLLSKAQAMANRGYEHNAVTLNALHSYMMGYGILLSGGCGIGKTMFFETVNPKPIPILSFNRCGLWTVDQLGEWLDDHVSDEIVLDDIGYDTEKGRNYGQRFETLQYVIDARLNLSGARTHITTNMTNDELIGRYDTHLIDRIYEMCLCFALPQSESKRSAKVNRVWIKNQDYAREMGKEEL